MNTEQIKADFYKGLNMVRDKIQRHKTALLLMINSFEKAIELKSQEPSVVSAEEIELAESIIKKRYPFYDSNIDGKDIEINGKIAVELMQEYAQQTNAEAMREHAIGFAKWTNNEGWKYYNEYLNTLTTK